MQWDKSFDYDPIDSDSDIPPELLDAIEAVLGDSAKRLRQLSLARKRRESPGGKAGAGFHKFANLLPTEGAEAREICEHLVGAAISCSAADGDLSTGKFQVTLSWTEAGGSLRERVSFDLAGAPALSRPVATAPNCPGCRAHEHANGVLRGVLRDLQGRLDRSEAAVGSERTRGDELSKGYVEFGKDMMGRGLDAYTTAGKVTEQSLQAAKPNMEMVEGAIGIMNSGVETLQLALEHERDGSDRAAAVEREKGKLSLARDGMKMLGRLSERWIARKKADNKGDAAAGEPKKERTAEDDLHLLRDTLFEVATKEDWAILREHTSDWCADRFLSLKSGRIDLDKMGEIQQWMSANMTELKWIELFTGLSDRTRDCLISLSSTYERIVAEKEAKKEESET